MECSNCGANVPADATRCRKCGSYVEQPAEHPSYAPGASAGLHEPPPAPLLPVAAAKSKKTAMILAFALGWTGAHRFYLGSVTQGFVQMLLSFVFSWITLGLTFLAAIVWGVAEGFMIQNGAINRDAQGRPFTD